MVYTVFQKPIKWKIMKRLILEEINNLILKSIGIVSLMSLFLGAVIAIQTALNLTNPFLPKYLIGFATRQTIILEFSPTFISIIMAGIIGSYITSNIGTMKITEQIDAIKTMGINELNYLVFPKIVALMFYPFITAISMFLGILGGWSATILSGYTTEQEFIYGLQTDFKDFHVIYAFIKTFIFSFFLATIPAYHGYYIKGEALEVGKKTIVSFKWTAFMIIISNYVITYLILG